MLLLATTISYRLYLQKIASALNFLYFFSVFPSEVFLVSSRAITGEENWRPRTQTVKLNYKISSDSKVENIIKVT